MLNCNCIRDWCNVMKGFESVKTISRMLWDKYLVSWIQLTLISLSIPFETADQSFCLVVPLHNMSTILYLGRMEAEWCWVSSEVKGSKIERAKPSFVTRDAIDKRLDLPRVFPAQNRLLVINGDLFHLLTWIVISTYFFMRIYEECS